MSEGLVPYGLRHTLITSLANMNISFWKIKAIAGHAHTETTMKYVHQNVDDLKNVFELRKRQKDDQKRTRVVGGEN